MRALAFCGAVLVCAPRGAGAQTPDELTADRGSEAFWLGARTEPVDREAAARIWARGRLELANAGRRDPRLDSALVWAGAAAEADSLLAHAADAYQTLLANGDLDRLGLHRRALELVVPEADRPALGAGRQLDGPAALAWWRRQDPLVATLRNERLEEHLRRVERARRLYPDGAGGVDDRGDVFIRLGAPGQTTELRLDSGEFARYVPSLVTAFRPSEVPRNELWTYPNLGPSAVYLFLRQPDGPFRLGSPNDLIPRSLRGGGGVGSRGQRRAEALLFALDALYGQIVHVAPRYQRLWMDVSDYTSVLDLAYRERVFAVAQANREVDDGRGLATASDDAFSTSEVMRTGLVHRPSVFAQRVMADAAAAAAELDRERDLRVPTADTRLLDDLAVLPVAVRTARFLTPSGRTTAEVIWAADPGALPAGQSVYLGWHALVQDERLRTVERHRKDYAVESEGADGFPAQTFEVGLATAGALALEWDARRAERTASGGLRTGERIALASVRVDSLRPLRAEGLELSDLKPLRSGSDEPYPYARVTPGEGLLLYFEVYGLQADHRPARFDVEHEAVRRRRGSLLRRSSEITEGDTLITHTVGARSGQYLYLDTQRWGGADEVDVRVRVRDRRTRGVVERRIRFELVE